MKKVFRTFHHSLTCEQHHNFHVFPCPWPNCKNGVDGEQFELWDPSLKESEIYTRMKWVSPSGELYYSWNPEGRSNWLGVDKTIWNELRRQKIIEDKNPELIYHYTTLEGFKGIVDSGSIWLSDYSYLNDSNELLHGIRLIKKIAENMQKKPEFRSAKELLQSWIDNIDKIDLRICIASFSGNGDSLSQWRAYGDIAIGFDSFASIGQPDGTYIMPIEYDKVTQERWASLYLSHLCQAYSLDFSLGRLERIKDIYHETQRLVKLITFFKDPGFKEEKEYRIAYIEDPTLYKEINIDTVPKEFRISNGRLVPYVKSSDLPNVFDKKQPLNIKSIVLGPSSDTHLLERGIREFLDCKGYKDVDIQKSKIPYRT